MACHISAARRAEHVILTLRLEPSLTSGPMASGSITQPPMAPSCHYCCCSCCCRIPESGRYQSDLSVSIYTVSVFFCRSDFIFILSIYSSTISVLCRLQIPLKGKYTQYLTISLIKGVVWKKGPPPFCVA